jgi:DNA modification methylase
VVVKPKSTTRGPTTYSCIKMINTIQNIDCIEGLKTLPDESIDCCVTSPPYYGLRDYGVDGQIGLEETPEAFVEKMVQVFSHVKRVLKKQGTLWLNLGDSYNGYPANVTRGGKLSGRNQHARSFNESGYGLQDKSLKPKDLIGIPWMVAFALRSSGWYLRQDIIWHKPNPMPESVTDRCTKAHEYIFFFSKAVKYYYDQDAIRTPVKDSTVQRMLQQIDQQKGSDRVPGKTNGTMKAVGPGRSPRNGVDSRGGNQGSEFGIKAYSHLGTGDKKLTGHSGNFDADGNLIGDGMANKKSVWTVTTKPFSEAHFATFPEDLIVDCIKAGCPEGGVVLDPFMGAGTTALVARKLNRNFTGFELNDQYIKIANNRLKNELGLFL